MTISGLNSDRYLVNNPIIVSVSAFPSDTIYIRLTIGDATGQALDNVPPSLRLYPINERLEFDLSEAIKSFFPVPNWQNETSTNSPINTNYLGLKLSFAAVNREQSVVDSAESTKAFIRGGRENHSTNQVLPANTTLKESDLIPRWGVYPVRKFSLNAANEIISTQIIPSSETEVLRVVGCNPLYFKFLNTQGGYSYWLFEKFEGQKDSKKADVVRTRNSGRAFNYDLGGDLDYAVQVEGRVDRRYFKTIRALIQSTEIYVLDLHEKLFNDVISTTPINQSWQPWVKVYKGKNSLDVNNVQAVKEVKLKFDLYPEQNPSVRW